MLESTRLAYLEAMGVVGWVPRQPLANAAWRLPPLMPEWEDEPDAHTQAPESSLPEQRIVIPGRSRPAITPARPWSRSVRVSPVPIPRQQAQPAPAAEAPAPSRRSL